MTTIHPENLTRFMGSFDGDDQRFVEFIRAAIPDPSVIPKEEDLNNPKIYSNLWKLIESKNYPSQRDSVPDDSVHPEFLLFIRQLGAMHHVMFGKEPINTDIKQKINDIMGAPNKSTESTPPIAEKPSEQPLKENKIEEHAIPERRGSILSSVANSVNPLSWFSAYRNGQQGGATITQVPNLFGAMGEAKSQGMSQYDAKFFFAFINLVNTATNKSYEINSVPDNFFADINNYRYNLKTELFNGNNVPRFALFIPNKPVRTTSNFTKEGTTYGITDLRKEYIDAFASGNVTQVELPNGMTGNEVKRGFSVDFARVLNDLTSSPAAEPEDEGYYFDFPTGETVVAHDGKFVRKDDSSKNPIELTKNDCYSSGLSSDPAVCDKIASLIINSDTNGLMEAFNTLPDSAFANIMQNGVGNMTPQIAVKLLTAFGFNRVSVNTDRGTIVQFENVETWLDHLGKEVKDKIVSKKKIIAYLSIVSKFINSNPDVLNSNYTDGTPVAQKGATHYEKYGIPMLPSVFKFDTHTNSKSSTEKLLEFTKIVNGLRSTAVFQPFKVIGMPFMSGGSSQAVQPAGVIKSLLHDSINRLERSGKRLKEQDKSTLERKIGDYERLQNGLATIINNLREYVNWSQIVGDHTNGTVSLASINSKIEQYKQKVSQIGNIETGLLKVVVELSKFD